MFIINPGRIQQLRNGFVKCAHCDSDNAQQGRRRAILNRRAQSFCQPLHRLSFAAADFQIFLGAMARPRRKDVGPRTFAADAARRDRRLHSRGTGTGAVEIDIAPGGDISSDSS
jgi:hypothetical protein